MNSDDSHHDQGTTVNHDIDNPMKAATSTMNAKAEERRNTTRAGIPMPSASRHRRGGVRHAA
jgi:hypothetical protein